MSSSSHRKVSELGSAESKFQAEKIAVKHIKMVLLTNLISAKEHSLFLRIFSAKTKGFGYNVSLISGMK